jgi:hypothetical protein
MTGPEHYAHAGQLLGWAADCDLGSDGERYRLAAAQVHATLALAAAAGLGMGRDNLTGPNRDEWFRVAGTTPKDGAS